MDSPALHTLKRVVEVLTDSELSDTDLAAVVQRDPEWREPECTRRHVTLLWKRLQEGVTAEIGAGLARDVDDWNGDFSPRIVIAEEHEFDVAGGDEGPYGWTPLAQAHRRETDWDLAPGADSGTWLGWWEPESVWGGGASRHVRGMLTGFIVVEDGELLFADVVQNRRRRGIATRLIEYARANHGLEVAKGPFTPDGQSFATAVKLMRES